LYVITEMKVVIDIVNIIKSMFSFNLFIVVLLNCLLYYLYNIVFSL